MKTQAHTFKGYVSLLLLAALFIPFNTMACTIVSAIAKNGHVWNANNEDGPFGIANFINVYPKTNDSKFGYFTLSYLSPRYGQTGSMQGGTNEAGLTFDFNEISKVEGFDPEHKKAFPQGDDAILPHILGTMESVQEVISFFKTYWFQNGFVAAQMHVADKQGNFAIISPSGIEIAEKGQPLVSTNFDICGKENGSSCWRYPIATSIIQSKEVNFDTMKEIVTKTQQKNGATMYSNIQNLTTGQLWFFSKHDPGVEVEISLKDLLDKGQRSYSFSNLNSIHEQENDEIFMEFETNVHPSGTFTNSFIGPVRVEQTNDGILLTFSDGFVMLFNKKSENVFAAAEGDVEVLFAKDGKTQEEKLSFYENGMWSFTAWSDN